MRLVHLALLATTAQPVTFALAQPGRRDGYAEGLRQAEEQLERQKALDAKFRKAIETGNHLFGADKRWLDRTFYGPFGRRPAIEYKIGDWGNTGEIFKVVSKVSKNECLVLPHRYRAEIVLIRGFDMSKVTDGVEFVLQYPVVVQDTYSYQAVSGARKTVLVLERDDDKLNKLVATDGRAKKVEATEATRAEAKRKIEAVKKDVVVVQDRIRKSEARLEALSKPGFERDRDRLEKVLREDRAALAKHKNLLADLEKQLADLDRELASIARPSAERKDVGVRAPADKATEPGQFVGRWRIVDDKGVTSCFFTLTAGFEAKKSHAPDVTGKWEVVGGEARITWSDGWRDTLRPEKGRVLKVAFGPGTIWGDPPANTQQGIKEP